MGNINRPGGALVPEPLPLSSLPEVIPDDAARKGLDQGRLDQAGSWRYPFTRSLVNNLTEAILSASESPVDTLLIFSSNPAYTLPDGGAFRKALGKIPFLVSFSPFRDETALMCDLILPDHTYLEKMDDVAWPPGLQYALYGVSRPVVDPLYNTKHAGDVIILMAKGLGQAVGSAFPWKNYEEVLKARAKGLYEAGGGLTRFEEGQTPAWKMVNKASGSRPGYKSFDDMWKEIKEGGLWYKPSPAERNWEGLFKTPTGKFEFFSSRIELAFSRAAEKRPLQAVLKSMGVQQTGDEACMPHYEEPRLNVDRSAFPLQMVPYEMINLASDWIPNPPYLYKSLFDTQLLKDDSFAEINPKTAAKYGLKQGDLVMVKSPKGEVRVRLNLFEGAMPGMVYLPMGFGHTAYDEFLRGKGANPNDIVHGPKDPLSGYPIWWITPVKLVKV
ncbi:MAG: hypothetical protein DRH11_14040 [Deltaproteobacteria bacterium]|nr:MAG: hypothetical protein DRH11_14040 [Deltaproteobacteria bacterium]